MKFNKIRYLPTGKGRRVVETLRPLFFTSTAFVDTNAIIELSICRRAARLDIFAFGKFDMFCFAKTRYDINPCPRSEHIERLRSKHHIERISVYRKSVSADLYRRVVSLRALRIAGRNFFIALVNVYKSDRLDNNVGEGLILGVGIYACNRVNDLDAVYNVAK